MITLIDEKYMPGEGQNAGSSFHVPVLLRETVAALQPAVGKTFWMGQLGVAATLWPCWKQARR